jgi:hypothetical protein
MRGVRVADGDDEVKGLFLGRSREGDEPRRRRGGAGAVDEDEEEETDEGEEAA